MKSYHVHYNAHARTRAQDARRRSRRQQPTFFEIFDFSQIPSRLHDHALARDRCLSFANEWVSFFNENAFEEIRRAKSMKLEHREQWNLMIARLDF